MYKIGVIGDRDSVLGFKAVGLDVFPAEKAEEAKAVLRKWAEGEYAIIYITEGLAVQLEKEIDKYKDSRLPAIIPIPNKDGPSGTGLNNVRKSVERAVGADILFGGDR
ncbi:V-type ATP synthase subunit F [Hornefia porci]|uniref:V-type ATP synthase subunit F n=1 Tax=Hornefia porci TaxID=2652292 RepID=A0A1Q9JJZ3_9FIRM|nr:V-type ATP synthase subunit F [Hornefia porci]OLR56533.1 V-type ATP synthase subunit F [Hornefia porci]